MTTWWVVTDLDGTLLDHAYDWSPARPMIAALGRRGIPVIPCTSKTADEVRRFQRQAGLRGPAIVENGGAVLLERDAPERDLGLGAPSDVLATALADLSASLQLPLTALVAMEAREVTALTGLEGEALQLALARRWSMPFLPPPEELWPALRRAAAARGLKVLQGNRLAHLISADTDKGLALATLKRTLAPPDCRVLALGDSPNDLALLDAADVAVVVPGSSGPHPDLRPGLAQGRYRLAPAPHGRGWAAAVGAVLADQPGPGAS
jgi:mannosyl-3-phosphoglycerate phosphatase